MQAAWHVLVLTFSTMCTIAILVGVADAPVVIAANRDELFARDTRPPRVLAPGVVGGLDAQSGGTWLALHRAGRFAAVTNQLALASPPVGLRSRGLAVMELAAAADQDAYVAALDPRAYASMNLVWGDAERVSVAYLRREGDKEIQVLPRGVWVLCNDRLDAPDFPRGQRLHRAITATLAESTAWDTLAPALQRALGDHTRVPLDQVPPSHLPRELARELTATCIHSEHYGTRSATIVAIAGSASSGQRRDDGDGSVRGSVAAYLHADGPPCTTPFVDRLELLA